MDEKLTRQAIAAKENAFVSASGAGGQCDLASKLAKFAEFAWLGDAIPAIPVHLLETARLVVELHGDDPRGPGVARLLGIDEEAVREQALVADVRRRAKRAAGDLPAGKPLAERKAYIAVKKLVECVARCTAPAPRLADGTRLNASAAALLARTGELDLGGYDGGIEAHPRAKPRAVRKMGADRKARIEAELGDLASGKFGGAESTVPLPIGISSATRRNHRRAAEAREQAEEQRTYERQQRQERLAGKAGARFNNPAGRKPLPLHEGRKARGIAWDRREALRFLLAQPHDIRVRLYDAATAEGARGRLCERARLVYAFYAFLQWASAAARPTMRRDGFDRVLEGLPREALAAAFVQNSVTLKPYHANTISALAAALVDAGLIVRETPNKQDDVYTGVTGWALYVYRLRNALQLNELLKALGEEGVPAGGADPLAAAFPLEPPS